MEKVTMVFKVSQGKVEQVSEKAEIIPLYMNVFNAAMEAIRCKDASERGSYQAVVRAMEFADKIGKFEVYNAPNRSTGYTSLDAVSEALHDYLGCEYMLED